MKFLMSAAACLMIFSSAQAQDSGQTAAAREEKYAAVSAEKLGKRILPNAFDEKSSENEENENPLPQTPQTYVRPTKEQRFKRYASDSFGIPAVIGSAFGAGIGQIADNPPEWNRTTGGYGKRFASSYATNVIRNTISYGLSETFRLDNRFEKSGRKSFGKRLRHVFLGSYTTRAKTGKRIPDFPHFAGTYGASVIANETWMPARFNYKDGLRDGTISLGVRFGVNLLREFIFPE